MEGLLTGFLEHMAPIIFSILGTVAIVLTRQVLKKYGTKLDFEVKQRADDLVASLTHQGVAFAEQWAKNKAKSLPEGIKVDSTDKLHIAMEYMSSQIKRTGLDRFAERELADKIEAVLGLGTLEKNTFPEPPTMEITSDETFE